MGIYGDGEMKAQKVKMVFCHLDITNSTIEVETREIIKANKDIKQKCFPFQVLGAWMARLTMWQLGLGEALFVADIGCDDD